MTQIVERTILFADLRQHLAVRVDGQRRGDGGGHAERGAAGAHRRIHGRPVVKTLGDGLMAMFILPKAALAAAEEMHDSMERIGGPGSSLPQPLKVQVALAGGEVVQMSGDVFGDRRSTSRRGCSTTPATTRPCSPPRCSLACRRHAARALPQPRAHAAARGRVEPVHVYLLEAQRNPGDTAATAFGDMLPAAEPEGIRLVWTTRTASTAAPTCRWCSGAARAGDPLHRRHACRARMHASTGTAAPSSSPTLSYNGTYVRFDHDPEVISLRRGTCTLHGSGLIGLGTPPTEADGPCVRFEVMKFADTQPHDLYL